MQLTLDFYRRNYIEGLFLSSGIIRNPGLHDGAGGDASRGRCGWIISSAATFISRRFPKPSPELIAEAGRWADRISINVELPTQRRSAKARAGEEYRPHREVDGRDQGERSSSRKPSATREPKGAALFAPAGQSTQMIVGATPAQRSHDPRAGLVALQRASAAARLLLRLQPDPRCLEQAAAHRPAARPRASAVSGRLADALLRLRRRRS